MSKAIKDEVWVEPKEDRIRRRTDMYLKGELSLDDLYALEKVDLEEEEAKIEKKPVSLLELDEMRRAEKELEEAKEEQESEPVSPVPDEADLGSQPVKSQDPEDLDHILRTISTEELQSLPLYDQNRLYEHDPEKYKEIIERGRSFHDRLNPERQREQTRLSPGLTVEEFNSMSLREQNDLYNSDPDLVRSLVEESRSGRTL